MLSDDAIRAMAASIECWAWYRTHEPIESIIRRHLLAAEAKPDDTLTRAVELLKYAKATYAIRCHHPACPVPDGFCTRCKIDAFLAEIGEVTPEGGMG